MMKHERAAIIALSYVIGFTASFIGFGIADSTLEVQTEPAAVARTSLTVLPQSESVPNQDESLQKATGVRYDQNLYAIVNNESVLISADDAYGTGVGFFHAVTSFELMEDGTKVLFCVLETELSESCVHFEYDVVNHEVSKISAEI